MQKTSTAFLFPFLLCAVSAEFITHPSSHGYDYNYNSTSLLSTINQDDSFTSVDLDISIRFQGQSYNQFCISSNSYITFGGCSIATSGLESLAYPKILIEAMDNYAYSINVTSTPTNITVHYFGRRYSTTQSGIMHWKLTFFGGSLEKFTLDMIANNISNIGSGKSKLCTASICYLPFDTNTTQLTTFWDCQGGCLNAASTACIYTQTSESSCSCRSGYYWSGVNTGCVINCSSIKYAFKIPTSTVVCGCQANSFWNSPSSLCVVYCSGSLSTFSVSDAACECTNSCQSINCSQIQQSTGVGVSNSSCTCVTGYVWQNASRSCRKTQKQVSAGLIAGVTIGGATLLVVVTLFVCHFCKRTLVGTVQPTVQSITQLPTTNSTSFSTQAFGLQSVRATHTDSKLATNRSFRLLEEQMCSICLLGFTNVVTSCGHRFHRQCLDLWMKKQKSCPYCRASSFTVR